MLSNDGTLWAWGGDPNLPEQVIITDKREVSYPGGGTEVTGKALEVIAISSLNGRSYGLVAITEDSGIWDFNREKKYVGTMPNSNIKSLISMGGLSASHT